MASLHLAPERFDQAQFPPRTDPVFDGREQRTGRDRGHRAHQQRRRGPHADQVGRSDSADHQERGGPDDQRYPGGEDEQGPPAPAGIRQPHAHPEDEGQGHQHVQQRNQPGQGGVGRAQVTSQVLPGRHLGLPVAAEEQREAHRGDQRCQAVLQDGQPTGDLRTTIGGHRGDHHAAAGGRPDQRDLTQADGNVRPAQRGIDQKGQRRPVQGSEQTQAAQCEDHRAADH